MTDEQKPDHAFARSRSNAGLWHKILMVVWALFGMYFIIAATGGGCMTSAIGSAFCWFMVARNMADVIAT